MASFYEEYKDDIMAFCGVEDLYGNMEMIVFPKHFIMYGNLLNVGNIILVEGKISVKDEEVKLLAERITVAPKTVDEIPKDKNINIFLQPVGYWILPSYSDEKKSIPLFFTNTEITPFDGIIGEDCFQKFSNVIIDYKNKVIVFNGEKIKGESVPMIIDEDGLCFIEFLCSDIKEIGLIDTGSDCFIIRSSFMEKTCNYNHITKEKIEELKKRKVKITEPVNYSVKEIKIGKIKYKKILGMLGSDSRIKMTDEARGRLTEYSLLGFPFFKDKIIQLDYENKVFRIKR